MKKCITRKIWRREEREREIDKKGERVEEKVNDEWEIKQANKEREII